MFKSILLFNTLLAYSLFTAQGQMDFDSNHLMFTKDSAAIKTYLEYAVKLNGKNNQKAIKIYNAIIERSDQIPFYYGSGEAWLNIGLLNMWEGDCFNSIICAKKALADFHKINNRPKQAYCYFVIGKSYSYLEHADSCMNYLLEGLRLVENIDCIEKAYLYNLVGRIMFYSYYRDSTILNNALNYHLKGIELSLKYKDTSQIIYSSIYLADDYFGLKNFEKSNSYFRQTLHLAEASKNPHDLAEAYNDACLKYYNFKKIDSSIYFGNLALKYSRISDDNNNFLQASINLANAFHYQKNNKKRLKILQNALHIIQNMKNRSSKKYWFYFDYTDALYEQHYYKEAYDYYKKNLNEIEDENNFKASLKTSELELKYQTAQKEKTLAEQRLELTKKDLLLQKNRSYIIASLSISILVLFFSASLYFRQLRKRKEYKGQMQALEQQKKIQILQALMQGEEKERSRIAKDLHDGAAGVLVAVKMHLNALKDCEKNTFTYKEVNHVIELVDDAYNEIRKTSHNLMPEVLVKYGLDEALRIYCNNISNSNRLVIQYDSWGDFDRYKNSFELSIYRIVQELIANIIKHSQASLAIVQMSVHNEILSIDIEDNGIGFTNSCELNGMGLHNIKSKVNAIDGRIEMVSGENNGVCAYLEFDISHMKINRIYE